ncbi:DUF1398 family protein [uncultured Cytophaga sp.]|uniref:DUF1398 family protein n=1 Tax=uncultured Cytophaga sp. TaxID=160238 RepID=UPI00262D3F1B|nr:DUF1398 family protein [uncultured Cytophaga sp.]
MVQLLDGKSRVTAFETWVKNSHTEYFGESDFRITSEPMYESLSIAETSNADAFKVCLNNHQEGKTDYATFCKDCAEHGIEKWYVCLSIMTCTYYDKAGNTILVEQVHQP